MYPGRERRGGNEGIAMVIAPFNNHIFHALEGLGFLWVKLLDPASLPPISTFLLSHYRRSDMGWITDINKIIFSLFPRNVSFVGEEQIQSQSNCFKHIVVFRNRYHVDSFRSTERELRRRILAWLFVIRFAESSDLSTLWLENSRKVTEDCSDSLFSYKYSSVEELESGEEAYRTTIWFSRSVETDRIEVLALEEYTYSSVPLRKQVMRYLKTELAIAPHGAGLTNLIFMRPYSVLIELMPPQFYDGSYVSMTKHSRIHHILIGCFNPIPMPDFDLDEMYWEEKFASVRHHYKSLDLETDMLLILGGVEDGIEYLRHHRFYFQRNNIESVIFPYRICYETGTQSFRSFEATILL